MQGRYTWANYWGYGDERGYITYMLQHGQSASLIAEALHKTVDELAIAYPDLFPRQFRRIGGEKVRENRKAKNWSKEENDILARHYPQHGPHWDGWADLLGGRTQKAILAHAHVLGLVVSEDTEGKG